VCLPKDPKNPYRWKKIMQCQTKEMKDGLLIVCNGRNDSEAVDVSVRIHGSLSDLHAADTQYHEDCFKKFTSKRNVSAASRSSVQTKAGIQLIVHLVLLLKGC